MAVIFGLQIWSRSELLSCCRSFLNDPAARLGSEQFSPRITRRVPLCVLFFWFKAISQKTSLLCSHFFGIPSRQQTAWARMTDCHSTRLQCLSSTAAANRRAPRAAESALIPYGGPLRSMTHASRSCQVDGQIENDVGPLRQRAF